MSQLDSLNPSAIPPQDEALRQEVRSFLVEALRGVPAQVRARSWMGYDPAFSRELGRKGWLGITFPPAYGGAGRSVAVHEDEGQAIVIMAQWQQGVAALSPKPQNAPQALHAAQRTN